MSNKELIAELQKWADRIVWIEAAKPRDRLLRAIAALEAAELPTTVEWGVQIDGERPSETQVFDNEWAARDCAQNDKAWCSDAPRIIETRTVQRGQWESTS